MKKKFVIYIIAICVIAIIFVVSIVWRQTWRQAGTTPAPKYTGPVEKITLAAYQDYAFAVYAAKEKGFFADNGLDVTINSYESGRLAMNALEKGEADIATAADFVFVSDSFTRNDIQAFSIITQYTATHDLVARKDKGIEKIADIKGKKIGVTKRSSGEFSLSHLLPESGLKLTDIELVDLQPSEIVIALEKGTIDAALTWEPNVFKIEKSLGNNIIIFPAQSNQNLYFLLISKQEYINKNSKVLEKFLAAMIKTEEFIKANPKEIKKFAEQNFNYDPEYIESTWQKFQVLIELSQGLLLTMESQARWRIANKLTEKTDVPNYLNFIYFDALEKIKPEAVTIIH